MHERPNLLLCTRKPPLAVHALDGCKAAHLVVHSFMEQVHGCSGSNQN